MFVVLLARILFLACVACKNPDEQQPGGRKNTVTTGSRTRDLSGETTLDTALKGLGAKRQLDEGEQGDDWVTKGVSRYLSSGRDMVWDKANKFCNGNGGYLAKIESAEEQKLVEEYLERSKWKRPNWDSKRYWIGSTKNQTYANWHWGEPNDNDAAGFPENCIVMSNKNGGHDELGKYHSPKDWGWNDLPCNAYHYNTALCEAAA